VLVSGYVIGKNIGVAAGDGAEGRYLYLWHKFSISLRDPSAFLWTASAFI